MRPKRIHQYEVHRRLGSGAGGVAYEATDTRLMRPVVLKMLHPKSASDEKKQSKLLEEARIASAIEHPNVCSIYEVGEHEGSPFIAMQHVPGQTLEELIEKDRSAPTSCYRSESRSPMAWPRPTESAYCIGI